MAFLVGLLVANESRRVKALGLAFKFGLLSLCVLCFFARAVPIFVGSIGLIVFLLSMLIGSLPPIAIAWLIRNYAPDRFAEAKANAMPFGFVLIGVSHPLSVQVDSAGASIHSVYRRHHGVERTEEATGLVRTGAVALLGPRRPGVPGPARRRGLRILPHSRPHFSDQVTMRWYWKDNAGSWKLRTLFPSNRRRS
jgi:hypothetical protein